MERSTTMKIVHMRVLDPKTNISTALTIGNNRDFRNPSWMERSPVSLTVCNRDTYRPASCRIAQIASKSRRRGSSLRVTREKSRTTRQVLGGESLIWVYQPGGFRARKIEEGLAPSNDERHVEDTSRKEWITRGKGNVPGLFDSKSSIGFFRDRGFNSLNNHRGGSSFTLPTKTPNLGRQDDPMNEGGCPSF